MHRVHSFAVLLLVCVVPVCVAEDPKPANTVSPEKKARYKKLEETLTNAKLVGNFTVTGKEDDKLSKEEYTIQSATKMDAGEMWLLKTRIKYGGKDVTVPLPIEIQWAGDTPVITLTNFTIPGMGTFSSRVVIYEGRYAGTWQHDKVGGHLFGVLEKIKEAPVEEKPTEQKKPE